MTTAKHVVFESDSHDIVIYDKVPESHIKDNINENIPIKDITDITFSGKGEFKIYQNCIICTLPMCVTYYPPYLEIHSGYEFEGKNKNMFEFKNKIVLNHLVVKNDCIIKEISPLMFGKKVRLATYNSGCINLPKIMSGVKDIDIQTYGESSILGSNLIVNNMCVLACNSSTVTGLIGYDNTEINTWNHSRASCGQRPSTNIVLNAHDSSLIMNFFAVSKLILNSTDSSNISGYATSTAQIENIGHTHSTQIQMINMAEPS